jgi:hypothetical protein
MKINKFSDLTDEEFMKKYTGRKTKERYEK